MRLKLMEAPCRAYGVGSGVLKPQQQVESLLMCLFPNLLGIVLLYIENIAHEQARRNRVLFLYRRLNVLVRQTLDKLASASGGPYQ